MNKKDLNYYKEERDQILKKMDERLYRYLRKIGKEGTFKKAYSSELSFYNKKISEINKENKEKEAKNILIGRQEDYLDLSGSREEMPYKDILIKDNPNLETLIIDNCLLKKIKVVNCPNLKTLSCRHNYWITEIDISECPSLEGLYCSNNKLEKLDLSQNINLKHLVCDNNPIEELEVKHLKDLESLYAFGCRNKETFKGFNELDVSGLSKLKDLYCPFNSLISLNLKGCNALEMLDCAENFLKRIDISNLKKLKQVSVKENLLKYLNANNCESLEYLDYECNGKKRFGYVPSELVNLDGCSKLKNLFVSEKVGYDISKLPNLKLLLVDSKQVDIKEQIKKETKQSANKDENKRSNQKKKPFFGKNKNKVDPEQSEPTENPYFLSTKKTNSSTAPDPKPRKTYNLTPWIIGGIGIIAVVVIGYLIGKKRKKIRK